MAAEEKKDFRVAVGSEPADRAIAPIRADLLISPQLFYGQLCFVIKDPVTLRYYRLQPIEHFLVTQMDGSRTARDLLGLLHQQFPDTSLTVQEVLRFVGMLHESHMLVGEGVAHAEWLAKRRTMARNRRFTDMAQNFLFFKIPLFHPDKLLTLMEESLGKIIFSWGMAWAAIGVVLLALWQLLLNMDRLSHLPYSLLSWQNLMILYCVFIGTKVFHEFGHGLTTKHFGGEVSSMGIMLFIFTPSFYCDTSDAWMIPSRAARLWINAGGIVVELVIAALATFVWLYAQDDTMVSQIAMNVMISCSVATVIFNANPLMKYDGYYFLADLLEVPNLMTKGRQFMGYYVQKHVLGLKPTMPPDRKRLWWMVAYAVGAGVYRWVILFGIVGLLYYFFDKYGMGPIGVMLAVAYVALTVLWPTVKAMKFLWKQRWDVSRRIAWVGAAGMAGFGLLAGIAMIPLKHSIREPLVVLSQRDEPIFVQTPGYLDAVDKDVGEAVRSGDVIARLSDPATQNLLDKATALRDEEVQHATNAAMENKPAVMAAANMAIEAYNKQIELLRQRMTELVLRAPMDGVVMAETPLKRVVGNFIRPGEQLCRVIRTDRLQARISLPQQQAAMVQPGMSVRIRLWSSPGAEIVSKVDRVSSTVSDQLIHPALASTIKGEVDVKADEEGHIRSTSRRSTVIIDLPTGLAQGDAFWADGMTGRGEIVVRSTTVAGRIWRAVLDSTTPDWHL